MTITVTISQNVLTFPTSVAGTTIPVTINYGLSQSQVDARIDAKAMIAPTVELETELADTDYFAIFTTTWLQLTWANVKLWLKSYFDGLYAAISHTHNPTSILFVIEELTGTDTIVAADSGKHFYSTAAGDFNLTLDSGLTHPISIFQKGNGVVTIISGSGTPTLLGNVKTGGANTAIAIVPESTTVYEVIGGVA